MAKAWARVVAVAVAVAEMGRETGAVARAVARAVPREDTQRSCSNWRDWNSIPRGCEDHPDKKNSSQRRGWQSDIAHIRLNVAAGRR